MQKDATCNIQQCWGLLANNIRCVRLNGALERLGEEEVYRGFIPEQMNRKEFKVFDMIRNRLALLPALFFNRQLFIEGTGALERLGEEEVYRGFIPEQMNRKEFKVFDMIRNRLALLPALFFNRQLFIEGTGSRSPSKFSTRVRRYEAIISKYLKIGCHKYSLNVIGAFDQDFCTGYRIK